jgi:CHAD domain-containing protein
MSRETEAKFAVFDLVSFNKLKALRETGGFTLTEAEELAVTDVYQDTASRTLTAAGWALRLRSQHGRLSATAKQIAPPSDSLSVREREELEIGLESSELPQDWPESDLRETVLALIGLEPLIALFEVHQLRFVRNIVQADRLVSEMSLDRVKLVAGGREREFMVLEVELRPAGTREEFFSILAALGREASLVPSVRSKFEEGLLLLDGGEAPPHPAPAVRTRRWQRPTAASVLAVAEDQALSLETPSGTDEETVQAALSRLGYRFRVHSRKEETRAYFDTQGGDLFKQGCELYSTPYDSRWHFLRRGAQEHVQKGSLDSPPRTGPVAHAVQVVTRSFPQVPCLEATLRETVLTLASISASRLGLSLRVWQLRSPLYDAAPQTALMLVFDRRGSSSFELDYLAGLLRKALDLRELGDFELRNCLLKLGVPLPGAPLPSDFLPAKGDEVLVVCRKILSGEAWRMKANTPGAVRDLDAEFVHDLRVATRRARFACRLFGAALGIETRDAIKFELAWIAELLGKVRDLDVLKARLESQFALVDADEGFKAAATAVLETRAVEARGLLVPALRSQRYATLLERLSSPLQEEAGNGPADEFGRRRIGKALSRIAPWARRNPEELSPAELHRLRILFKRLRYTAEFFRAVLGSEAATLAKDCVAFQDCLGLHQDARVAVDFLTALAEEPALHGWLLTLGALIQVQRDIMGAQRERFRTLWGSAQGLFDRWPGRVSRVGS